MEIVFGLVLVLLLMLIAFAMIIGKPLRIEITHKQEYPQQPKQDSTAEQDKLDNEKIPFNLDGVISAINDVMGVNNDELQEHNRT